MFIVIVICLLLDHIAAAANLSTGNVVVLDVFIAMMPFLLLLAIHARNVCDSQRRIKANIAYSSWAHDNDVQMTMDAKPSTKPSKRKNWHALKDTAVRVMAVALLCTGVVTFMAAFAGHQSGNVPLATQAKSSSIPKSIPIYTPNNSNNHYNHPVEDLVNMICDAVPEKNTVYEGNKNKGTDTIDNWTFDIPGDNYVQQPYPYQVSIVWTNVGGIPGPYWFTEYPIDLPQYPDSTPSFDVKSWVGGGRVVMNSGDLGFSTMSGLDARMEYQDYFQEVYMAHRDSQLRNDSHGAYTCFMPMIDSAGRVGFFAAPAGSITTNFYGTPLPPVEQYDGSENIYTGTGTNAPWLLHASQLQASPGFKVGYAIDLMAAQYQAAYAKYSTGDIVNGGDWRIFLVNIAMSAVQMIIVQGVSSVIMAAFPGVFNSVAMSGEQGPITDADRVNKVFGTVSMDTLVPELAKSVFLYIGVGTIASLALEKLGMDPFLANQIVQNIIMIACTYHAQHERAAGVAEISDVIRGRANRVDTSEAEEKLADMDINQYARLCVMMAAAATAEYQQAAIDLAAERIHICALADQEVHNIIDQISPTTETFGEHAATMEHNLNTIKNYLATVGTSRAALTTTIGDVADGAPMRGLTGIASDPSKAVAFSLSVGRGCEIPWEVLRGMTVRDFLSLAKYADHVVMSDPNHDNGQGESPGNPATFDPAKVSTSFSPYVGENGYESYVPNEIIPNEVNNFVNTGPGQWVIQSGEQGTPSCAYDAIPKGRSFVYKCKADGAETIA